MCIRVYCIVCACSHLAPLLNPLLSIWWNQSSCFSQILFLGSFKKTTWGFPSCHFTNFFEKPKLTKLRFSTGLFRHERENQKMCVYLKWSWLLDAWLTFQPWLVSLRTSETSYLNEAFSFYSAIRQRSYYFQVNKEDRQVSKYISVCFERHHPEQNVAIFSFTHASVCVHNVNGTARGRLFRGRVSWGVSSAWSSLPLVAEQTGLSSRALWYAAAVTSPMSRSDAMLI